MFWEYPKNTTLAKLILRKKNTSLQIGIDRLPEYLPGSQLMLFLNLKKEKKKGQTAPQTTKDLNKLM